MPYLEDKEIIQYLIEQKFSISDIVTLLNSRENKETYSWGGTETKAAYNYYVCKDDVVVFEVRFNW